MTHDIPTPEEIEEMFLKAIENAAKNEDDSYERTQQLLEELHND